MSERATNDPHPYPHPHPIGSVCVKEEHIGSFDLVYNGSPVKVPYGVVVRAKVRPRLQKKRVTTSS